MELDFASARQQMVDNQVRTTDVTSHELLKALLSVKREAFVPEDKQAIAYIDTDIELSAKGRFVLEPSPLAKLLQAAEIGSGDKVLDVGAGSGYVSALLALMAKQVVALEADATLLDEAKANLAPEDNVDVVSGDLENGYAKSGPYDVIFINGSVESEPTKLFDQLTDGGRLIAVIGSGGAAQAMLFTKDQDNVSCRRLFNISIPMLPAFKAKAEFVF